MRLRLREVAGPNPALRRLIVTWFVANLAEWTFVTAASIQEYRVHGVLALGLLGARYKPGSLFGLSVLPVLIRRHPIVVLRLLSTFCSLAAIGGAVAVGARASLILVVAIVWLETMILTPFRSVQSSVLPALASTPRELSAVAGAVPLSKTIAWAAGALIGSLGLSFAGPEAIILLAAAAFLVAAWLVSPRRAAGLMEPAGLVRQISPGRSQLQTIAAGFRVVAGQTRPLLVLGGGRALTRGLWTSLTVVASLGLLRLGASGVGVLTAAAGVGAVAAIPVTLRSAGRPHLSGETALTFALTGLPITIVGALASSIPSVALIVVWGGAAALADALSNSSLHRLVEARSLGASVAAIETAKLALEGVGALLAPAVVALLGVRTALLVTGLPLPVLAVLSYVSLMGLDRMAENRIRPLQVLRNAALFSGLTMLALENLAGRLKRIATTAGQLIIRQGDLGDRFYLIDRGRVEVTVDGYPVARLGPGGSFGEKALLRAVTRSASVTSLGPAELWYLEAADFIAGVMGDDAPVAHQIKREGPGGSRRSSPVSRFLGPWGVRRWLSAAGWSASGPGRWSSRRARWARPSSSSSRAWPPSASVG